MSNRELIDEANRFSGGWDEEQPKPRDIGAALDLIDRLAAALEAQEWHPIETAPRDGTRVMVYAAPYDTGYGVLPGFVSVCEYHPDGGWCVDELREVTHWRPLPKAPETGT